jgi:hypothetical protein
MRSPAEGPAVAKHTVAPRSRLRRVPIDALTALGWLNGTLHVPSHLVLSEFLALGSHPLKLTEAQVPNEPDRLPFVALRRDALVIVTPGLAEEGEGTEASDYTTDLQVACLLPMGLLRGTLRVIYNLRLSDHLQQTGHLLTLNRCLLAPYGGTANSPGARGLHQAIVNLNHALGISEC